MHLKPCSAILNSWGEVDAIIYVFVAGTSRAHAPPLERDCTKGLIGSPTTLPAGSLISNLKLWECSYSYLSHYPMLLWKCCKWIDFVVICFFFRLEEIWASSGDINYWHLSLRALSERLEMQAWSFWYTIVICVRYFFPCTVGGILFFIL